MEDSKKEARLLLNIIDFNDLEDLTFNVISDYTTINKEDTLTDTDKARIEINALLLLLRKLCFVNNLKFDDIMEIEMPEALKEVASTYYKLKKHKVVEL